MRDENNPRKWLAIGPKGGPYRVRVLKKDQSWFPDETQLQNARFFTEGIDVNQAIEDLENGTP